MKWKNKGHEFDKLYENIERKDKFYLFGAGDYGHQFWNIMNKEIVIEGFIDNDIRKQSSNCIPLDKLEKSDKKTGIIITMSQMARMSAIQQLTEIGYRRDEDFFLIEEFLSVYFVYKHNKVYFTGISFLPSTICNLRCIHCLNFNPYAKNFYVREWNDLIKDIELFFNCVDRLMLFHLSGGEPLLYEHTIDLLIYIHENYGDRIDKIRTVTNGTVVPKDDVLAKLSRYPIEITVDDYREAVPQYNENFDRLIQGLNKYQINYYINKVDSWIDLAPERTDYSNLLESELEKHAMECEQSWQELREGKLYSCNYAAYATVAGIAGEQDNEEVYNLQAFDESKRKELVEFRLGYNTKGYTEFCKKCRGFNLKNAVMVNPAIQLVQTESIKKECNAEGKRGDKSD